jgi:hypothetical protein
MYRVETCNENASYVYVTKPRWEVRPSVFTQRRNMQTLSNGQVRSNYIKLWKASEKSCSYYCIYIYTVKPVLSGTSRDQKIFSAKASFRLIEVHCLKRNRKGPEHFPAKARLNWTEGKKIKFSLFLFFPVVKLVFLHAVYSLCCLTFYKHFSLRNYTITPGLFWFPFPL